MGDRNHSLSAQQIEALSKTLHEKVHLRSHDAVHDEEKEVHLVMVPYPLQGHINPMMQLAKVLIARHAGVRVTFVNNKHNHDRIQYTRCTAMTHAKMPSLPSPNISPQQQDSQLQFLWVENGLPPDFDYTDLTSTPARMFDFHMAAYNMKDPFKQLLQNFNQKESPVACVLFGSFCPWVHSVAADLGIPNIMFWTQSTAVFSMYYHAPLLAANGFFPYNKKALPGCNEDGNMPCSWCPTFPVSYAPSDQLVSYVPGVPPLHPSSFPTLLRIDSISDPSIATIMEQFESLQTCDGVIINSFEELEKEASQALQAELPCPLSLVGPLIPSAYLDGCDMNDTSIGASLLKEESECIQWLDSQKNQSVLYVSFGSVCNISAEDLQGIACGIKGRKQPFLWVIRPRSSLHNLADIVPKGFIEDTKEYGLIIPWAPQMRVLSHPSVGAFLTHCGWNSTLESVSMGVPMIPFPIFSDQTTNCTYVCDVWKTGMELKRQDDGKVKSEDVERVLRIVFQEQEGKEMKRRASKLREAARRAALAQGSSNMHTERLMKAMRIQSVRVSLT